MTALFDWSMRHGAKILFGLAIVELIFSFTSYIMNTTSVGLLSGRLDEKPQPLEHVWAIAIAAVTALHSAAFLFFGALVVERLDRWRESRA